MGQPPWGGVQGPSDLTCPIPAPPASWRTPQPFVVKAQTISTRLCSLALWVTSLPLPTMTLWALKMHQQHDPSHPDTPPQHKGPLGHIVTKTAGPTRAGTHSSLPWPPRPLLPAALQLSQVHSASRPLHVPFTCLAGEEPACSAGDPSSIPGSGRSAGERNSNPL